CAQVLGQGLRDSQSRGAVLVAGCMTPFPTSPIGCHGIAYKQKAPLLPCRVRRANPAAICSPAALSRLAPLRPPRLSAVLRVSERSPLLVPSYSDASSTRNLIALPPSARHWGDRMT